MSEKRNFFRIPVIFLFFVLLILSSGCLSDTQVEQITYNESEEATEFQGIELTPIVEQRNNAIRGTQFIDQETYGLEVYGLVDNELSISYEQLLAYPSDTRFVRLDCVEGWGFDAKWTGVTLNTIFDEAQVNENATNAIFHCADGYSTSLEIDYLRKNDIMLAYKLNDITLPADRGFPLQLVAEDKYGYKWAKWIIGIEITDQPYEGYWEKVGYSNNAVVGGPAFE
ncbi:molybdopterin-dependent oxidoreductase [Methanolobus sp. ZRKC3]|uniref:molybdopterin-dependent oxidoreductase n=1 Tax=Methanolobus sp. ZRKC3 TaxID=3125786 RepID=UPI0032539B55